MRRDDEDVALLDGSKPLWPASFSAERVIAVLEPLCGDPRKERLRSLVAQRLASVAVLLDAPHDPHNAAAVARSCDAFGVGTLHVIPRSEPFALSRSVSKGTERWVDLIVHDGAEAALAWLAARGFEPIAARPDGELLPADLRNVARPALLLGNEHSGLSEDLAGAARRAVRIPMRGMVESLNVSVAAAILLREATDGRTGDVPESERRLLYARGLFHSVPRAGEVLAASR